MIVSAVGNVVKESLWVEFVGGGGNQASNQGCQDLTVLREEVNEMRSLWGRPQSLHKVHAFIPIVVTIYILSFRNH